MSDAEIWKLDQPQNVDHEPQRPQFENGWGSLLHLSAGAIKA